MSKRQICIYRQTGILDLTAIQSLSACHVSPGATLPSPKAHGSHASDTALLAYLFPIQRPSPTKKTPEGQNKVSYLWMCQHGPPETQRTPWAMSLTTQQGPFPVKRNDTFTNHWQDETKICSGGNMGRKVLVNRLWYYSVPIRGNSTCYVKYKRVYIKWIFRCWTEDKRFRSEGVVTVMITSVSTAQVCFQVCVCVCVMGSWHAQLLSISRCRPCSEIFTSALWVNGLVIAVN